MMSTASWQDRVGVDLQFSEFYDVYRFVARQGRGLGKLAVPLPRNMLAAEQETDGFKSGKYFYFSCDYIEYLSRYI